MSKLDIIILDCANKILDGKQEKLGDYIDPTKQQLKDFMLELVKESYWIEQPSRTDPNELTLYTDYDELIAKIEAL